MLELLRKIMRRGIRVFLLHFAYPIYFFFYEIFHKNCILLTASVDPFLFNWGDDASKIICQLINPKKKYIIRRYSWNLFHRDDYLCIGSIVTWMTTRNSIIWGSGIVYPNREISAKPKKVLAVRGPLTRQYLIKRGIDCPEIYGDPALLFSRYYKPQVKKKNKLGIIPHFRDKTNPILEFLKEVNYIQIIDVQHVHPWHKFIDDICCCEYIASSSLHGIILSDAYNIPNVWVEFEGGESKRFAFRDYLQSVHKNIERPFIINNTTEIDDIIERCSDSRIQIDLDKLESVCPFS